MNKVEKKRPRPMTSDVKKGPLLGQRHLQTLLLFLAIVVNFNGKLNASVAVVAMTNAETTNPKFPEYDWSEMQKSLIISSFYWGYFVTQFPGGYMCRRFGARKVMFVSTFASAVLAVVIPVSVEYAGWQAYCGLRAVQGLFQGLLMPCIYAYLAAWCPPTERNRLGAFAHMGIECGTMLAMFVSGMIAASSMGWPGISYISCAIGGVWCLLWLIFAANKPSESKFISKVELDYIDDAQYAQKEQNAKQIDISIPIPWRAIFTSAPFWASLFARSCQSWGFFTLQAEIPVYMNSVLGMDMKDNALFSALPYLAMLCMSYVYLVLSDILISKNLLTLNALRKIINSLAFWLPAAGLIALGFLDAEQKTLAIVIMTVSVGINAGNTIGCTLNTIDLSPNHAGILMGINNTSATLIPILTPLFAGLILTDENNRIEWQIIFGTSALFFTIGNFVYIIFGSTNLQPWDDENFLLRKSLQADDTKKAEKLSSKWV